MFATVIGRNNHDPDEMHQTPVKLSVSSVAQLR